MLAFGIKQSVPVNVVPIILGCTIQILVERSERGTDPKSVLHSAITPSPFTHGIKFLFHSPFEISRKNLVFLSPFLSQVILAPCFE